MKSLTLFEEPSELADFGPLGCFEYHPRFLADGEATQIMSEVMEELPLDHHEILLFGRRIPEPRLVAWASRVPYRYSGVVLEPRPVPRVLGELLRRIEAACLCTFNHVLANYYRDGNDSMGLHADDEPELGRDPVIASLSLGTERRFRIVPKEKPSAPARNLLLGHGSLLVMRGALQHHFRHELPKDRRVKTPRLNLTFRNILR